MVNCSFINATEARNIARNNTTIWEEICEVQTQILGAIDGNLYSVIVNDGTPFTATQGILSAAVTTGGSGYLPVAATAVINANGTGGVNGAVTPVVTGTTVTGFTIDDGGSGYVSVVVTASLATAYNLNDAQTQVNYDGLAGDGTFLTGGTGANSSFEYAVGEIITLSENSTATVNSITPAATARFVLVALDTELQYNGVGSNGAFSGGSGYAALDTITLVDGTVVTVDTVAAGVVTEFTITTSSTNSNISLAQRIQTPGVNGTSGVGVSFELTSDTNNETAVGAVLTFLIGSAGADPFFLGSQVTQVSSAAVGGAPAGTQAIGLGFALVPTTNNAAVIIHAGVSAVITPIEASGSITSVVINIPGTTYVVGQPVLFAHPSGTGATASVASIDGAGAITAITITNAGTGYEPEVATVTVTAPGGLTPAVAFVGTVVTGNVNASNDYTSGLAFDSAGVPSDTITRVDGTSFLTDGFAIGQTITVSNAEDASNNGAYIITLVTATVITVSEPIAVTNAADTTAQLSSASAITGIAITTGGTGYAELLPTISITDSAGTGATATTNVAGGAVTAINIVTGGSGYTGTDTVITIIAAPTSSGAGATSLFSSGDIVIGTNTFSTVPTDYYSAWAGLTTDAVISDQIQFVLDYFTSLGYNIRVQTNSSTANTIQWQIIW